MTETNQFVGREAILEAAGVSLRKLGYVGLEVDRIPVASMLLAQLDADIFVWAPEGDYRRWVSGPVAESGAHITAKYGLITPAYEQREIIEQLLEGPIVGAYLEILDVEIFPSTFEDLPYGCIVARVDATWLRELNARLSILPHVDSFVEYKPHVSLAYVRTDVAERAQAILAGQLTGEKVMVVSVDYGRIGGF